MRKFTGGQLNGTNSQVVPRREVQEARKVGREAREGKVYRRPILDIEQRGPINDILEANYNYILDNVTTGTPTRENNETLDKTLLVYEFINGEGVLPKRNAEKTNSVASPYTERAIGGRRSRRSRRSRKSKKSFRRNRH